MTVPPEVLDDQDRALLDRLATRIVELKLEVPAILTLESSRPLTVVAGQTMLFLEPIVQALFGFPDYRRFARVIERREALDHLIRRIEALADDALAARRAAKRDAKSGPRGSTAR
jgi:hypothetical protein